MKYLSLMLCCYLVIVSCNPTQLQTEHSEVLDFNALQTGSLAIRYPEAAVKLLKAKLQQARLPDEIPGTEGKYGFSKNQLNAILNYWESSFDFDAHYTRLNQWNSQIVDINGYKLHYIQEKSKASDAIPIVLLHGWPSTFLQMTKLLPLLADENEELSFDVIVISLPGYGFSEIPKQEGMAVHQMAAVMHQLMTQTLGYDRFLIRASDIGAGVAKEWALAHPDQVLGLHLSGSSPYVFQVPTDLSANEQIFLQDASKFMQQQGAYASLHSTEPQTLAYALADSPAGLAAWIVERYQTWTDHNGDLNSVYSKDDLLDILTIYWMTNTINSSMRSYFESATVYSPNFGQLVQVPTAFLMLQQDIATAPREWEARTFSNIIQWEEHEQGGHFAEWEQPELVAKSIRRFVAQMD